MYQIFHQNFFFIVNDSKIASKSLIFFYGRGKNVGSVGIPEHNYMYFWPYYVSLYIFFVISPSENKYIRNFLTAHHFYHTLYANNLVLIFKILVRV